MDSAPRFPHGRHRPLNRLKTAGVTAVCRLALGVVSAMMLATAPSRGRATTTGSTGVSPRSSWTSTSASWGCGMASGPWCTGSTTTGGPRLARAAVRMPRTRYASSWWNAAH